MTYLGLERFDSLTTADAEYVFVLTHISRDLEMVPARGDGSTESGKRLKDTSRYLLYTDTFLTEIDLDQASVLLSFTVFCRMC
jgi:hypothetical protein